jgi:hypothetical protein
VSRRRAIPFCSTLALVFAPLLVFAMPATAQESGFRWTCDPSERHSRFYRADLGVVCWEGKTYSKDHGGIPQYMLDYFEENSRKVKQKVDEMNRHIAELKAAHPNNGAHNGASPSATPRPLLPPPNASKTPTVTATEPVPIVPVSPEVFASIDVGSPRSAVLDKLGKPSGSLTIPGDEGFVEIWTYQLTDGSAAKIKLEKGVVTSREHER